MLAELLRVVNIYLNNELETYQDGSWRAQRVHGGMNNALFRVEQANKTYACKLCVPDERKRAEREYTALQLLERRGIDIAPRPVGIDCEAKIVPYPAVVYEWCEGKCLDPVKNGAELALLLDSLQKMHGCRPQPEGGPDVDPIRRAWFHWFNRQPYIWELAGFVVKYTPWLERTGTEGRKLSRRLKKLVWRGSWRLTFMRVTLGWGAFPVCLCHVDPNATNAILGMDGRVRWVDWEYSGWGDPALDLAEYRWHMAYAGLSEAQQTWLRDSYQIPADDPNFGNRLVFWDSLLAVRWPFLVLRLLWSRANGDDRLRLSRLEGDKVELWDRLEWLVERAERFYNKPELNNLI